MDDKYFEKRIELRDKLRKILGNQKEVYFQPPESKKLSYPCIIYELNNYNLIKADNGNHHINELYTVTLITTLPDEVISKALLEIPMCDFDRAFINDNLYHYIYIITI